MSWIYSEQKKNGHWWRWRRYHRTCFGWNCFDECKKRVKSESTCARITAKYIRKKNQLQLATVTTSILTFLLCFNDTKMSLVSLLNDTLKAFKFLFGQLKKYQNRKFNWNEIILVEWIKNFNYEIISPWRTRRIFFSLNVIAESMLDSVCLTEISSGHNE